MRSRLFVALTVVISIVFGGVAFADDYVHSFGDNYVIYPSSSRFDAALMLIGEWDSRNNLTERQLTLLSNPDTGGDFFDLASWLSPLGDRGSKSDTWSYPSWAENWPINTQHSMLFSAGIIYGADQVWYGTATGSQIQDALTQFGKVMRGEVNPGGGSVDLGDLYFQGNISYVYNVLNLTTPSLQNIVDASDSSVYHTVFPKNLERETSWQLISNPVALRLKTDFVYGSNVGSDVDLTTGFDVYFRKPYQNSTATVYFFPAGTTKLVVDGSLVGTAIRSTTSGTVTYYYANISSFDDWSNLRNYNVGGGYVNFNLSSHYTIYGITQGLVEDRDVITLGSQTYGLNAIYGRYAATLPPNHWPDPVAPDPPSDPRPDPPDVPGPDPWPDPPSNPTIDPPDVEPEPTGTSPTDYTPWLRAILNALNRMISQLANHCQHIRNYMRTCTLYLADCFSHLEDYMHDLAVWLADQLQWNVEIEGYDDSVLLNMLNQIYSRLGDLDSAVSDLSAQLGDIYIRLGQILAKIGSGGGSRPAPTTEPEVDEGFDFWQWLLDLITNKLGDIITDFVGDIGGFIDELVSKFPFSIPWDIMAYLALLDANRVTPVITFVIPAIDGWWPDQRLVIDLAPFDDAMAAVRSMMLIVWGFILVMKTDWLGKVFDDAVQVVVGFFDRLAGHGGSA